MTTTRIGSSAPIALASVALCTAVVLFVLDAAPPERRVAAAVASGVLVGVTTGVGLVARRAQPDGRFGRLLLAVGAASALTALAHSADATLYSIGRVVIWLVVPASLYLMLAFPSGRITRSADRRILTGVAVLVAALYLPTALIAPGYPSPLPWTSCGTDCPPNALDLVHVDPAVLDAIRAVRETLATVAMVAVTVALGLRARRAGGLLRGALVPVVAAAALQAVVFAAYQTTRASGPVSGAVDLIGRAWLFTLPVIALSFAGGLLSRRLQVASAMQRLTWDLRAPAHAVELRTALASALEAPTLHVLYWLPGRPGRWVDESGWPAGAPEEREGSVVTRVVVDGRLVAAVEHDADLAPDPKLVEAAASYGLVVLENTRLIEELRRSLERLSESERERKTAEARERARIERDLHDGAQQRLVALRINLGALGERLAGEAPERAAELDRYAAQIDETIDDMRSIAHALSPPLLAEEGLASALRSAAHGAPLDVVVNANGIGRFAADVERTVYFACVEAIQNAVKHARGARVVSVDLSADGRLRFEVRDDGSGFDGTPGQGSGLPNMAVRVASVGGRITIHSTPGHGTRIVGTIPLG